MLVHPILQLIKQHHIVHNVKVVLLSWHGTFGSKSCKKPWRFVPLMIVERVELSDFEGLECCLEGQCKAFCFALLFLVLRCTLYDLGALGFALPFSQAVLYNFSNMSIERDIIQFTS